MKIGEAKKWGSFINSQNCSHFLNRFFFSKTKRQTVPRMSFYIISKKYPAIESFH